MDTPRYRLEKLKERIRSTPGNDSAQRAVQMEVDIDCASEVAETLMGLDVAVEDMANRGVSVLGSLTAAIDKATAQAVISSAESTKVAVESTKLAGQLNHLTGWVILAAILSAVGALIQAGVALYTILK